MYKFNGKPYSYWNIEKADYKTIDEVINKLPYDLRGGVLFNYKKIKHLGRKTENQWLKNVRNKINSYKINLTMTDSRICNLADKRSIAFSKKVSRYSGDLESYVQSYVNRMGIKYPTSKNVDGAVLRLSDPKYWRRILREKLVSSIEELALVLNLINKRRDMYASDFCVSFKRDQIKRNKNLLKKMTATNELDQTFTLEELSDKSVSNPANKRNEFMARISGNEKVANKNDDIGLFQTITCPSRMHASLSKSGKSNPLYDGTTPREAHKYLVRIWSHIRAELNRKDIKIYGFRISEPHHDATPHWHLIVFVDKHLKQELLDIFKKHAMKTDPKEKGANKHRFTYKDIDKNLGTASGYISKFISKNTDGYKIDDKDLVIRVMAWASTWKIRQFQFFGNPPVSIWRELRKLEKSKPSEVKDIYEAADKVKWAEFMTLMGGPCANKKSYPLKIFRVWSDKLNRYGETTGNITMGILSKTKQIITKIHQWEINCVS